MWTLDDHATVPVWRPSAADPTRVLAFSTRRGGVSAPPWDTLNLGLSVGDRPDAVGENRRRLLDRLGLEPSSLASAGQIHGAEVRAVSAPGHQSGCDALFTLTPGITLAVSGADCMCLLYSAPGAVGAAHAGWRGALARTPAAALRAVSAAADVAPEFIHVTLGPCIRSCCYEVGADVARRFPAAALRRTDGRLYLDLPLVARLQLLEAGLPPEAFEDTGECTACQPARYFSHRRDASRTGRLWGLAALRTEEHEHRGRRTGRGL
jgi:hypothetical protein